MRSVVAVCARLASPWGMPTGRALWLVVPCGDRDPLLSVRVSGAERELRRAPDGRL